MENIRPATSRWRNNYEYLKRYPQKEEATIIFVSIEIQILGYFLNCESAWATFDFRSYELRMLKLEEI